MLISPPFLPARTTGQLDAEWVDMAMRPPVSRAPLSNAYEGSYPLSAALVWHNGLHVQARRDPDGITWPAVRAVAGGTIVYVSPPTKANTELADPQNHNPFGIDAAWTDNGLIVIAHEAEIGASNDEAAAPTAFRFYSAYMHMGSVAINPKSEKPWTSGDAIGRKEELGAPGQIYGEAGQIHLEICCDETNASIVIGRPVGWQENRPVSAPTSDGRTDAVFGSLWFYLPIGTPTRTAEPKQHRRTLSGGTSAASNHFIPDTLKEARWVELRYEQGNANLKSFDIDGSPVGNPLPAPQAEYGLYKDANARHESYLKQNPTTQGPITSSPSGWYELLRFGRNLGFGGGTDPLPADAAHWREIPTATGTIWADLNAQGTHKFSDADFLPVAGWNCYDDDANTDNQLCESSNLKRLLRHPEQRKRMAAMPQRTMEADIQDRLSIAKRLGDPNLRTLLRRAVCRFPTEWDRRTIEKRHEWTRNPAEKLLLDDPVHWKYFAAHLRALSFDDLPAEYKAATWRFHPAEFIAMFRQCGWLSSRELAMIYSDTPANVREKYRVALNRVTRKHRYISSMIRLSHFLGQGAVESKSLSAMQETSMTGNLVGVNLYGTRVNSDSRSDENSLGHWYGALSSEDDAWFRSTKFNSKGKLIASSYNWRGGNLGDPDAQKFRGRGFKQLTGLSNYTNYWVYRGWLAGDTFTPSWWEDPSYKNHKPSSMKKIAPSIENPQKANETPYNCMDTGGWYLGSERPNTLEKIDQDTPIIAATEIEKSAESAVSWAVTKAINGGDIDKEKRLDETRAAKKVLI